MNRSFLPVTLFIVLISCTNAEKPNGTSGANMEDDTASLAQPVVESVADTLALAIAQLSKDLGLKILNAQDTIPYENDLSAADRLFKRFEACARHDSMLLEIERPKLLSLKISNLEGIEPLEPHLYLKFTLEEWRFNSVPEAQRFHEQLTEIAMGKRDCINKGGIEWWRLRDRIYMLNTSAFRFMFEFGNIRSSLEKWNI